MADAAAGARRIVVKNEVESSRYKLVPARIFIVQDEGVVRQRERSRDGYFGFVDRRADNFPNAPMKSLRKTGVPNAYVQNARALKIVAVDMSLHPGLIGRRRLVGPVAEILTVDDAGIAQVPAIERQLGEARSMQLEPGFSELHGHGFQSDEIGS